MKWLKSILKKVSIQYKDMSISLKVVLYYVIIMICSLMLSSLIYRQVSSNIIEKNVSEISLQSLHLINSNIDTTIDTISDYSKAIIAEKRVLEVLRNSSDDYLAGNQQIMNSYLQGFILHSPIFSIYIMDNEGNRYYASKSGNIKFMQSTIQELEWYDKAIEMEGNYLLATNVFPHMNIPFEKTYISLVRVMNDTETQKPLGVIVISFSEDYLSKSFKQVVEENDTIIILKDYQGNDIIHPQEVKGFDPDHFLAEINNSSEYPKLHVLDGKQYLVSYYKIEDYNWQLISLMPFESVSKESNVFSYIAFLLILINGALMLLGSFGVSRLIVTPIRKLLKSMKNAEQGKFIAVELDTGNNEMGKLKDGYNIMIKEIQRLFDRIKEKEKIKRKAELNVLQAQIKPHFLYNTFDTISALALAGKNEEVYQTMRALGSYYRTSLSKGKEIITVREELDVVKNYLTIQKVRYGDIFTTQFNIDERTLHTKILKLVLQPLVENALYHGLKNQGVTGTIKVSAIYEADQVQLIIEDDGIGMSDEEIDYIMTSKLEDNTSFGLRGTIERLRLFYNRDNIVNISSVKGNGTKITLHIPIKGEFDHAGHVKNINR